MAGSSSSSVAASSSNYATVNTMLATWSIGFASIDAHYELSRHDPSIHWGGYFAMQDEFWYPMRACEGIIDRVDRIGRTNRGKGVAELKITHSPKDFLSLPNAKDRATAKGFTERSGVLGIMALSREDLQDLSQVQPLNEREIDTVAGFNAPPSWKQERAADGRPVPPPGAGKFLLKIPGRVGIAVQMTLTETERAQHITDTRSITEPHTRTDLHASATVPNTPTITETPASNRSPRSVQEPGFNQAPEPDQAPGFNQTAGFTVAHQPVREEE